MIKKLAKEQRRRKRASISLPLSYSGGPEQPLSGEGTTADVSESGIGIFSEGELMPGTLLEIECKDLWDSPKKFVVKWSSKMGHNFFRVGLDEGK